MKRSLERLSVIAANVVTVLAFILGSHENPFLSKESRLAYAISSSPTLVADPNTTSKIKVLVEGKPVNTKVVASQIILFNDGAREISDRDFNDDAVVIQTVPAIPIIDVGWEESHQRVNRFFVDRDPKRLAQGVVGVKWALLREDEGARISVFYEANGPMMFRIDHSLKSQRELLRIVTSAAEKRQQIRSRTPWILGAAFVAFLVFIGMIWATIRGRNGLALAYTFTFFSVTSGVIWLIVHIAVTPSMPYTL